MSLHKWIAYPACLLLALVSLSFEEKQGRQASIVSSAAKPVVHAGERVALMLDVTLRPGMHVYAPGAEGYIPVSWKLKDSNLFTAHDVVMPEAKTIYLPVIDEKAPVYEGHFRLVRDVTIGPDNVIEPLVAQNGKLTIEGTFRYQGCDDTMCYMPETLPITWTLAVERNDGTSKRAPRSTAGSPR